ncbi:MAG: hypothetical protein ACFCVK_06775 [Acidimicrobiales bacterium]
MARLVAIGVVLWGVYASISWSLANAPGTPGAPTSGSTTSDVDEPPPLFQAFDDPARDQWFVPEPAPPKGPGLAAGAYEVGDSPDPREAVRDRDHRPTTPLIEIDEELVTELSPSEEMVKGEIVPGLYATDFDIVGCDYELWRVMRTRRWSVIGEDQLSSGRALVTINGIEPDWFLSSAGCGSWHPWAPQPEPLRRVGNGDYWVGDLAPGLWTVPDGCQWEHVVGFRGAVLSDVIARGADGAPLLVDDETLGVRIRNCTHPIELTRPEVAAEGVVP